MTIEEASLRLLLAECGERVRQLGVEVLIMQGTIAKSHEALDAAGICEGGSLETRVGLLVRERDEAKNDWDANILHGIVEDYKRIVESYQVTCNTQNETNQLWAVRCGAAESLLSQAHPSVCKLVCRQGHETEHRGLCVEIAEALKGESDG